jgi:hypothetical protein
MKKIREKREALGKEESATLISEEPLEPVVQEPPTEGGLMSRRM